MFLYSGFGSSQELASDLKQKSGDALQTAFRYKRIWLENFRLLRADVASNVYGQTIR